MPSANLNPLVGLVLLLASWAVLLGCAHLYLRWGRRSR